MTGRTPHAMTKAEAIQSLCRHAAGTDDAEYLRACCIASKAIARAINHKNRNKAARSARKEAAHA